MMRHPDGSQPGHLEGGHVDTAHANAPLLRVKFELRQESAEDASSERTVEKVSSRGSKVANQFQCVAMEHWHTSAMELACQKDRTVKEMLLNFDSHGCRSRKEVKKGRGSSGSSADVDKDIVFAEREALCGFEHRIEGTREIRSGALRELGFIGGQEIEGRVLAEQHAVPPTVALAWGDGTQGNAQIVRTGEIAAEQVSYVVRRIPKCFPHAPGYGV